MSNLVVVGAGGFGHEVVALAKQCNKTVVGVLDDTKEKALDSVLGVPVLGKIADWTKYAQHEFVIALGSPRDRKSVFDRMSTLGKARFTTLIHPSVHTSSNVTFEEGCIVCAGAVLTVNIKVGAHCIVNINTSVGHDCVFGHFVTLAPSATVSGNVTLKDYVEVGSGAVILEKLTLEKGSMLAMGGVLTKNIPKCELHAGNLASKLWKLPNI